MEWNNKMMYLSEEEIKKLAIYLVYGSGLGIFIGIFTDNIPLYFSLGSVIAILVSIVVCFINRYKESLNK